MFGLETIRHSIIQREVNPKPLLTRSHSFSSASHQLLGSKVNLIRIDWMDRLSMIDLKSRQGDSLNDRPTIEHRSTDRPIDQQTARLTD